MSDRKTTSAPPAPPGPQQRAPRKCDSIATLPDDPGARLGLGMIVRAPHMPEWGLGQIQSITGMRVTVDFEHAGKRVMFLDKAPLEPVEED